MNKCCDSDSVYHINVDPFTLYGSTPSVVSRRVVCVGISPELDMDTPSVVDRLAVLQSMILDLDRERVPKRINTNSDSTPNPQSTLFQLRPFVTVGTFHGNGYQPGFIFQTLIKVITFELYNLLLNNFKDIHDMYRQQSV